MIRFDVAPGLDLLPAHPSLETAAIHLATLGRPHDERAPRPLEPLQADYDHIVVDTRGDLSGLTLAAVAAVDSVMTVFTSDPGSAPRRGPGGGLPRAAPGLREHLGRPDRRWRARRGTSTAGPRARSPKPWRTVACPCSRPASRCPAGCPPARSPSSPSLLSAPTSSVATRLSSARRRSTRRHRRGSPHDDPPTSQSPGRAADPGGGSACRTCGRPGRARPPSPERCRPTTKRRPGRR